jgi:5-methylcytosine-specific restriction endonuclease McrA
VIPARVAELRTKAEARGVAVGTASAAARSLPAEYEAAVDEVEMKLIEMPLPRLQILRSGVEEFLYSISWRVEETDTRKRVRGLRTLPELRKQVAKYQLRDAGDFDNRIQMKPGVIELISRVYGIVRELIESRWVNEVRKLNADVWGPDLRAHLFGFDREDLEPVRAGLHSLQENHCFYCESRLVTVDVDHFLPWARYPENRLENLVAAHRECNNSKSAHLASESHVAKWLLRFSKSTPEYDGIRHIAAEKSWPIGGAATIAVSLHLYGLHPRDAKLWQARDRFVPWEHDRLLHLLSTAAREVSAR